MNEGTEAEGTGRRPVAAPAGAFDRVVVERVLCPVILAVILLGLTLPTIHEPPPFAEEIDESVLTHHLLTTPADMVAPAHLTLMPTVRVFNRHLPIMEDNAYVGPVEVYLQLPFFALFGINCFGLRIQTVVFALLGLLAAYSVVRQWFGLRAAMVMGLLTVTHPVFVHLCKQGHDYEEIFTAAFFWCALFFVVRYLGDERRHPGWLCAGALLVGLGLCHKITFIWYVLGALVALGVAIRTMRQRVLAEVRPAHLAPSAACLLIGYGFTLLYNVLHDWPTLRIMARALVEPTAKDNVENWNYLANLWVRFQQFHDVVLKGEIWHPNWFKILGDSTFLYNVPLAVLFFAGLVVVVGKSWRGETDLPRIPLFFLVIVFGVVFLLSPFTVSYHHTTHLLVFYPFPQIVIALFLGLLPGVFGRVRLMAWISGALVVLVVAFNLNLTFAYTYKVGQAFPMFASPWSPLQLPPERPCGEKMEKELKKKPDRW